MPPFEFDAYSLAKDGSRETLRKRNACDILIQKGCIHHTRGWMTLGVMAFVIVYRCDVFCFSKSVPSSSLDPHTSVYLCYSYSKQQRSCCTFCRFIIP